jgi:hypothetical protein
MLRVPLKPFVLEVEDKTCTEAAHLKFSVPYFRSFLHLVLLMTILHTTIVMTTHQVQTFQNTLSFLSRLTMIFSV